jgi:hypothetical protein
MLDNIQLNNIQKFTLAIFVAPFQRQLWISAIENINGSILQKGYKKGLTWWA